MPTAMRALLSLAKSTPAVTPRGRFPNQTTISTLFPSPSVSPSIPLPFPLGHGTTTLGFVFQGGVIAAADSRSSCSGLVACPASQKILPVHSHLVGTTSGTSADCALWKRVLARELRLYQLRHRRRLSTGGAAKLLSHMLHPFKGTELCVAATLCGWDGEEEGSPDGRTGMDEERVTRAEKHGNARERTQPSVKSGSTSQPTVASDGNSESVKISHARCQPIGKSATSDQPTGRDTASSTLPASKQSGPSLYYVCSDGLRLQGALFSVGSGSPYAYSVLDGRVHWALGVDEAVSLAREAVYRATHRDAYSGNNVDLYHVTAKGWRRRPREDLKEEYYREKEEERRRKERGRREDEHKVGHVEEMLKMTG
ncbi:hypothetical protein P4O66_020923 [Electrophorus voltai]|uniref:Proteasome 20S subunit beta 11b n=1 Tax=Electrophorus voltai TaxID=2609070 RepID=A0AAD9E3X5_9TELE|nr:hypothetical protein P4O66_020923 [Electrophorus voltai]